MKYHKQLIRGEDGDCLRACVACILDFDKVEDVPHFGEGGVDGEQTWRNLLEWLKPKDMCLLSVRGNEDYYFSEYFGYHLIVANSIINPKYDHCVVGIGFDPIWCPINGEDSTKGIVTNKSEWVRVFFVNRFIRGTARQIDSEGPRARYISREEKNFPKVNIYPK